MTLGLNFENKMSFRPSYVLFNQTRSIFDARKIKERSVHVPPQKLDKVVRELFEQVEQEILIPILRIKNLKQLDHEIGDKLDEFRELRRSIISAFSSLLHKNKELAKQDKIRIEKIEEEIVGFFESEAENFIGINAALAVVMLLKTRKKVKNGLKELCEQNILNEEFFNDKFQLFTTLEFFATISDLLISCLILGLMEGVTFQIKKQILKHLAVLCESLSIDTYRVAKKIGIIRYPHILSAKEEVNIESDEEDKWLAEAGLKDYVGILEKEGY
ncbi:hypothetical protein MYX76_00885 [Desulfobacterota bacterium AH_259_B03_O07]|nr:hypothetical protein [Desulfobacterota bacterium AH_259_B03_O07]